MIATYKPSKPGRTLNVRDQPMQDARVVRKIGEGEHEAQAVVKGWVKLYDGYADARFLTVSDGFIDKPKASAPVQETAEREQPKDEPEASGDGEDEARANLRKMTNPQLYKLAEDSGIKVAKGSTKAELIDAIIDGADE